MLTYKRIDPEELKKDFEFTDGKLFRRNRRYKPARMERVLMKPTHNAGYHHLRWNRNNYLTHRIIWVLHTGKDIPEGKEIDHINGDRVDNRIENLRLVNRHANLLNLKRHREGHLCGVHHDTTTNRWVARAMLGGPQKNIGSYKTESEAERAQKIAYQLLYEAIDKKFIENVNKIMEDSYGMDLQG